MIRKRWAVVALGAAIAFVLGGATTLVLAGGTVITAQANSLAVIKTLSAEGFFTSTSSTSFMDVPSVARNATSTGTSNLFVADFSAGVGTGTSGSDTDCLIRVAVKDNAGSLVGFMNPDGVPSIPFHQSDLAAAQHQIQRSISGLNPGTYTFQVQFRVSGDPGFCELGDIHFTLTRYT